MKIQGPTGTARATATSKTSGVGKAATSGAPAPVRTIQDTVSILGIPPSEMTPKIQSAILSLVEEVDSLRREVEATKRRLKEMEDLADTDPLIPVPNRRAFVREISRMISFTERYGVPSSLVYFDVNDLKVINDSHGHQAGDQALLHIAETLHHNVRESDMIGRLGGDEFGVLLAQANDEQGHEKATQLAEAIYNAPFEWQDKKINIQVAYGSYTFKQGEDAAQALANADKKMYEHKRGLKDRS